MPSGWVVVDTAGIAVLVDCVGERYVHAGLDNAVAVGIGVDGDVHAADAGFAGILDAVAVRVDPDAVAEGGRCRCRC